jgi:hypothetical protein
VASAEFEQHLRDVDHKVLVDTNDVGAFAAEVLPGIYGIGKESLTEHYGSHVAGYVSERIDENTVEKRELNQEWPMFETWSQDFQNGPPIGLRGNPGLPLPIHSNGQYELNLYVHPKKVSFFARIANVIAGVPTENRVQSFMPDSTWLAVWSTLAEEDISNPYPNGSTILSAISTDAGNTWIEPQVVGVPDKAVNQVST